jgi:8-oxo-dGTP pyrophosphatase MutT (NUDIX family)
MEQHAGTDEASVRAAASVVMLQDGHAGLEVFLLKRHALSDVLAGAYVFPGGKVDPDDAKLDVQAHLDTSSTALRQALNEQLEEREAAALYVAAVREAFEETGVLYAHGTGGEQAELASRLLREKRSAFGELVAHLSLRLQVSALQPWSRWITPVVRGVVRKRFDTRFFLAPVPAGQRPRHDDHEAIESVWLTPREALQQYWDGRIDLAPPQIMSLAHLSRYVCVAAALSQARLRPPPVVMPEPFEHEGARMVCYPGDERHAVRERALPGPTRLHYRNSRFEPAGGLEALFGGDG